MPTINRRAFLAAAAAPLAAASDIPIIDTHIHLYDPTRDGGVPWPPESNKLIYKKTLPDRLREASRGLGVVGAIEVECSPLVEDNQWVLDVIEDDTLMVGTVGNLEPDHPEFGRQLERFAASPLFLGIRYGYLWGRDLRQAMAKPALISGVKLLAERGLTLDTANPSVKALEDVVRLTDAVPELRMVIDHLPKLPAPDPGPQRQAYQGAMHELSGRENVYVKVSAVLRRAGDRVPDDLEIYRAKLDEMWETFGEDRVLYGSDWPNSEPLGPYPKVLSIVQRYVAEKERSVQEKYFWRNSLEAYHWKKRASNQPGMLPPPQR